MAGAANDGHSYYHSELHRDCGYASRDLEFFSASSYSSLSSNSDALSWYTKAVAQRNDPFSDFSDIVIYTPSPTSASQEFIMVTPEPASMMLFGTGLLVIGTAIRRRPRGAASTIDKLKHYHL